MLNDRNHAVGATTAQILRQYDEATLGSRAREKTTALILALKSEEPSVRVTAAWTLGAIGPYGRLAVPALIANLPDKNYCTRISAAWALGRIGSEASPALPRLSILVKEIAFPSDADRGNEGCFWYKPLSGGLLGTGIGIGATSFEPALNVPTSNLRSPMEFSYALFGLPRQGDFAADAIVRIADGTRDAQRTDSIGFLNEAAAALEQNSFAPDAKQVRTDIAVLESIRRGQWGDRLISKIGTYPKTLALMAVYIVLAAVCFSLLLKSPLRLWRFNEKLTSLPKVKLPSWLGGIEISFPHLLLVGFFQYHPRVLDAWVLKYSVAARDQFGCTATVAQRKVHVDTPVELDQSFISMLTPDELRETFRRKRSCLLIWGEGGLGKTSLACRIAMWAIAEDEARRLGARLMLPVMIEQDLDLDAGKDKDVLTAVIRGQLENLTGEDEAPRKELVEHLLLQKRLLLIVDGLSELSEATRNMIRPLDPQFAANALIVTSRLEERVDGIVKTKIRPMRIHGNNLSSFMEAYLYRRGKRPLFSDSDFFEGCKLLSTMVGERDATVLLAKLFAEQMIAASEGNADKNLPKSIPDLMLEYLNLLNRRYQQMDDRAVHAAGKTIAWKCLQQSFRPAPAQFALVIGSIG